MSKQTNDSISIVIDRCISFVCRSSGRHTQNVDKEFLKPMQPSCFSFAATQKTDCCIVLSLTRIDQCILNLVECLWSGVCISRTPDLSPSSIPAAGSTWQQPAAGSTWQQPGTYIHQIQFFLC